MTREHKLALIVGFALVLVLGVLISDHFSKARLAQMAGAGDIRPPSAREVGTGAASARTPTPGATSTTQPSGRTDLVELPRIAPSPKSDPAHPDGTQVAMGGNPSTPLVVLRKDEPFPAPFGDQHPQRESAAPPAPVQVPMTKYEVKDGDTLYAISQKFYNDGKLWEKIRDANKDKLGAGGTLHKGVTLLLPPKDVVQGKPYTPPAPSTTTFQGPIDPAPSRAESKPADGFREYVVKDGDTLVAIARKMLNSGKRVNEIIDANKATLPDPDALTAGMKLRIPVK